jgi:Family of unknown function (DUF6521)
MSVRRVPYSREEVSLFNTEFVSLLGRRAIDGCSTEHSTGLPIPLWYLIVGMALLPEVHNSLNFTMRSKLVPWLAAHPFERRIIQEQVPMLTPLVREGLRLSVAERWVEVQGLSLEGTGIVLPRLTASVGPTYAEQRTAHFLGRWLPNNGRQEVVLALFGVAP